MLFTEERLFKLKKLVASRQFDLTVVLENVHDPHNLGAILRTCEAVGVFKIHVVYSEEGKNSSAKYIGKKASRGARRWIDVVFHTSMMECLTELKNEGFRILATHLSEEASSIYETDLSSKCAIVFGNEKDGISEETLHMADGNILIPLFGMVQSLNVSVACAISLFEASRQRQIKGLYDKAFDINDAHMRSCILHYVSDQHPRILAANPTVLDDFIQSLS